MASPKPSSQLRRFASTVLLGSVMVTALLGTVRQLKGFEMDELGAYDRFIRLRPQPEPDSRILIVGVTEEDIQGREEYPIQDGTIAELLKKLESYGPRAIGLDIARDVPQGPAAGRQQLTEVISQSDRIVTACMLSSADQPGLPPAPGTPPANTGFAFFPPDQPDSIVRRTALVSTPGEFSGFTKTSHLCNDTSPDVEIPAFSFLLSMLYLEQEGIRPEPGRDQQIQLGSTLFPALKPSIGSYIRGDIRDYQLMLNYRAGQGAFPRVSLSDVLSGNINPQEVRDKVVLIGYASQVEKDVLPTPYIETDQGLRNMTGVVVHGQAVSQLLSAVLDGRPLISSWSEPGEMLWIWLWAMAGGAVAFYGQRPLVVALLSGSAIAGCWGMSWLLFQRGLWVPLVPTAWGILLTSLGILLFQQAKQGGYTQAIYEQLVEQLSASGRSRKSAQHGSSFSYLEDLVQRAQRVRQGGHNSSGDNSSSDSHPLEANPALDMTFEASEQQARYDQIRAEAEAKVKAELASQARLHQQQQAAARSDRIQALLNRAQTLRSPRSEQSTSLAVPSPATTSLVAASSTAERSTATAEPRATSSKTTTPETTSPKNIRPRPTSLFLSRPSASKQFVVPQLPSSTPAASQKLIEKASSVVSAELSATKQPKAKPSPPGSEPSGADSAESEPTQKSSFVVASMPAIQPVSFENTASCASLHASRTPE